MIGPSTNRIFAEQKLRHDALRAIRRDQDTEAVAAFFGKIAVGMGAAVIGLLAIDELGR